MRAPLAFSTPGAALEYGTLAVERSDRISGKYGNVVDMYLL